MIQATTSTTTRSSNMSVSLLALTHPRDLRRHLQRRGIAERHLEPMQLARQIAVDPTRLVGAVTHDEDARRQSLQHEPTGPGTGLETRRLVFVIQEPLDRVETALRLWWDDLISVGPQVR